MIGFLELLTIVFVVLKAFGMIDWSWWIVFLPAVIAVSIYAIWFGFFGLIFKKTSKQINKSFNDDIFKKF
ncbi:hypothetical protein [Gracilibacillus sp. YIM 98692]|uniref:hypothetical protein n=1 Tax=Gracilibacillus sp. YIM 98692 TaxID=2663532 RepID=UPI0013D0F14B|nr:hypothetical protein [Gracilibacillus sp. YIM 98692]